MKLWILKKIPPSFKTNTIRDMRVGKNLNLGKKSAVPTFCERSFFHITLGFTKFEYKPGITSNSEKPIKITGSFKIQIKLVSTIGSRKNS